MKELKDLSTGELLEKLPKKTITVKPNFENPGWIKNPRHAGFFKLEGCHDRFTVAMSRNGHIKNPFTTEEKVVLERVMDYEENALSVYNKKSPIHEITVTLSKDPLILDLSNPEEFIKYKILLTNSEVVAPSVKDRKNKKTYKYYVEDADEVAELKKDTTSKVQRAWKAYGKMEDDRGKLESFLKTFSIVTGKPRPNINNQTKMEFLQTQVSDIVQSKTDQFLTLVEDEDYDIYLLIAEAMSNGVIKREGTKHMLSGGEVLGTNLQETVNFLKMDLNQDTLFLIKQQIKAK